MPKYNGILIKSTTIISGISMSGRTSIKIGGKILTIDTAPTYYMYNFNNTGSFEGNEACAIGEFGEPIELWLNQPDIGPGVVAYADSSGTPFNGGRVFYFSSDLKGVVNINEEGIITDFFSCKN